MTQLSHPVAATPRKPARQLPAPVEAAVVLRRFLRGWRAARRRDEAPGPETVSDLSRLFRLTNGRFNRTLGWTARLARPARAFATSQGLLGALDRPELRRIRDDFRIAGLCEFDARVPEERCARLRMLARRWPCSVVPRPPGDARLRFDPNHLAGTRYTIDPPARVYTAPDVQQIIADESILAATQAMLGCRPIFCGATMWWSTPYGEPAGSDAAHLYHVDTGHIRFLKLFIYLTDVEAEHGPHAFILGSQVERPRKFLANRCYTDDEMHKHYGTDRVVELMGRAGTIFAEDTSGFHKGMRPVSRHRLLLQLVFATHAFSAGMHAIPIPSVETPEFRRALERYPSVFRYFRKFGA